MKTRYLLKASIIGIVIFLSLGTLVFARAHSRSNNKLKRETMMTNHAHGTFEVKMTPVDEKSDDPSIGRMTGDKQIHGDIEGTGKSQMLFAYGNVKDSGAYVAIEKISGTLHGRKGTFILYHAGSMTKNGMEMNIYVVPDSGTGELTGISGKFTIIMAEGKHSYDFDYSLPKTE